MEREWEHFGQMRKILSTQPSWTVEFWGKIPSIDKRQAYLVWILFLTPCPCIPLNLMFCIRKVIESAEHTRIMLRLMENRRRIEEFRTTVYSICRGFATSHVFMSSFIYSISSVLLDEWKKSRYKKKYKRWKYYTCNRTHTIWILAAPSK